MWERWGGAGGLGRGDFQVQETVLSLCFVKCAIVFWCIMCIISSQLKVKHANIIPGYSLGVEL